MTYEINNIDIDKIDRQIKKKKKNTTVKAIK